MSIAESIVAIWCLSVGLTDLYARRLPNTLTLGICCIALAWLFVTGYTLLNASWQSALYAALISQLLTLPAYAARILGAGDVKLLLAIALIAGKDLTLLTFVIAAILVMVFGLIYFLFTQFNTPAVRSKRWIPFGAAFSAGLLCAIGMAK